MNGTTQLDPLGVIEECPSCGQRNRVAFARLADGTRCGRCKAALPKLDQPIEIAEETNFESLIGNSNLPVLVDFWAEWCGPCKMMAPELSRAAAKNAGQFVVAKVNTEGLPVLAQRFNISALPTLVLFNGGQEKGRTQGARPLAEIHRFVEQTLRAA